MYPSIHRILTVFMSSVALAAPALAEDDVQAIARLKAEITHLVGDARCGNVSFCRVVPMGYDACSNPSAWIVFNNAPDTKEIIETKASEVTFLEEDRMRGKPKPADCKPVRAPKLACINGRCVVGDLSY